MRHCFSVSILVLSLYFLGSCRCGDPKEIIQLVQTGHFVIANINNGETLAIFGDESKTAILNAKIGDIIKMQYVPDDLYKDLNYQVSFHIQDYCDHKAIAPSYSYEYALESVAAGNYTITMSALINEEYVQATSFAVGTLAVKAKDQ